MIASVKFSLAALIALALVGPTLIPDADAREPRRPRQRQSASTENAASSTPNAPGKDSLATYTAKGPLQIVVSIGAQRLNLYDGDQLVATTSVSTGTSGHPTPSGVFAILDKEATHRSNIYGGASMPFMQRLTMSGVALHSGNVTGRPASHGCIRLPHDFAKHLFRITKLGTRVTIGPGEPVPAAVESSRLPLPVVAAQPATTTGAAGSIGGPPDATAGQQLAGAAPVAVAVPDATSIAATAAVASSPAVVQPTATVRGQRKGQATLEREAALAAIPISIFVSRLDSKVYVRQGFKPLFDAPIKVSDEARPFGTHVFTAIEAKDNGAAFKWIAVSAPSHTGHGDAPRSRVKRRGKEDLSPLPSITHSGTHSGEPLGPAEALDRIELDKAATDRINALLALGATVIVSDLGPSREMRQTGTDFVILTR